MLGLFIFGKFDAGLKTYQSVGFQLLKGPIFDYKDEVLYVCTVDNKQTNAVFGHRYRHKGNGSWDAIETSLKHNWTDPTEMEYYACRWGLKPEDFKDLRINLAHYYIEWSSDGM